MLPTALRYLGLPTGSQEAENLAKAEKLMLSVRPRGLLGERAF